ncbi:putative polyketide synthase [Hypoxylon sp. FL1284]|nr:putative polyketide synthase [Hypoxylon sp. FL1284]
MAPIATSDLRDGSSERESSTIEPIAICGMACRLPGQINSDSSFWEMLVEKRTGQTPKVPESRFNIDAHYHESLDRPGSFNVAGGYFLDGRPEDFDPSFFNMTPIEAQWLDPQQRKILEVSYECLVSAGLPLDKVAGSNTAVFVGSFTSDYQQMSTKDTDFRHNYAATGVDPGIISNRIGHTFNLKGPSFTINTACSSSIYAIHNACHALRARDCSAAIAAGVNLIMTVDQHMNTAKLGILSPTSTCHTFDASADGYGRAEGAGALYLKRLSDAIRDGDPVRGVIRSTAVNTNGKVDGMGITHPSVEGQSRVIRMAYEKAKLDPNLTAYAELHGTGTPVGDPIEVRAVSRAMNESRSRSKPLLIGALKPNIGHSEAASGIFAVMKAALMTEAAVIPGVALFKNLNPEIREKEWNVRVHSDTAPWPQGNSALRRAGVSSFGYGGTNGHVIVEAIDNLYPWYSHGHAKKSAPYDHSTKRPVLLTLSAHDKATMNRMVEATSAVAPNYYLADLAHTLNLHRTMFSYRAFTVAREDQISDAFSPEAMRMGAMPKKASKNVGFLFTGQGAQWAGMGKAAMQDFPLVMSTLERFDQVLSKLQPKPTWSLCEMLLGDLDNNASVNRINEPDVAQPLCTAVQIAIVDLLVQWGITPTVSIGHSSGEIGAAYAAGFISAPEAIIAAFCRGRAVKEASSSGSMLAVGLGASEVAEYLPSDAAEICVACENSPSSVTLSGQSESISQLQATLTEKKIFARELKTGRAYHSPHMAPVGSLYEEILSSALAVLDEDDLRWCQSRSEMVSSVTGKPVDTETLPLGYWSANLRQRVLFSTAVQQFGENKERFGDVTHMIEVGPHSALSGPFKQICLANKFDRFTYVPSLVRGKNDSEQLLSVAGSLFMAGYPVDLEETNADSYGTPGSRSGSMIRKPKTQYLLVDLPPYPWNYEKRFWAEPRGSAEQRGRPTPRHDLLGRQVSGLSGRCKVWRNVLRHRDVPWLKDHSLGGSAVFPGAGYLSVAIEALRQIHEAGGLPFDGVVLRDVDIQTVLALPEGDDGVEIIVTLNEADSTWHSFAVESFTDGLWTTHCTGMLSATYKPVSYHVPVDESALSQRVAGRTWYKAFNRVGFNYTNVFQQLQSVRTDRDVHHATGKVTVRQDSGIMQGESRSLLHPSTVDACLQLIIVSVHAGKHKEMPWGVVPTRIQEVSIFPPEAEDLNDAGDAVAWTDGFKGRTFNTNTRLTGRSGKVIMNIQSLTCISYEAAIPATELNGVAPAQPYSVVTWKPDVNSLKAEYFAKMGSADCLAKLLELTSHRQPVKSLLLICGSNNSIPLAERALGLVSDSCSATVALAGSVTEESVSEGTRSRANVTTLSDIIESSKAADAASIADVALVDFENLDDSVTPTVLLSLLNDDGWLLASSTEARPVSVPEFAIAFGQSFALQKEKTAVNGDAGAISSLKSITVLKASTASPKQDSWSQSLVQALKDAGCNVNSKSLVDFNAAEDENVVIDDSAGDLLLSVDEPTYAAIKAVELSPMPMLWLTSGVREGKRPGGGMLEGFLRVIRSEKATAKAALLDVSTNEEMGQISRTVMDKLQSVQIKDTGLDTEFWLHNSIVHIPRLYPNSDLNKDWDDAAAQDSVQEQQLPQGQNLKAKTADGTVLFEPVTNDDVLADGQVEIQALASELYSPAVPALFIGTITRLGGQSPDASLEGKLAAAYGHDGPQTVLRTSEYALVDAYLAEGTSPASLASLLAPLSRLSDFLAGPHALSDGSHILALPGPKNFVHTLAKLAGLRGWKLDIVVDSKEEKEQYVKESSAVQSVFSPDDLDAIVAAAQGKSQVVVAHNFSSLGQDVWRSMANGSRFFILFDDDAAMDVAPDSLPFMRGASFIPIRREGLGLPSLVSSLDAAKQLKAAVDSEYEQNIIDVESLSTMETQRSHVLRYNYGKGQVKVLPEVKQLRLSPNGTYLMVGCLGGLGRSLTKMMMDRGARHFAFVSRSGADKPEAARVVDGIKSQGGFATVFRADAANENVMRDVVVQLQGERPIRGVVHAAMVLKDGMFEQMGYASFTAAIGPKAQGALALHKALHDQNLDFFVMTSSISGVLGNLGQSNYSAANSYLDSLALQRNLAGQAASSLVLPMVLDVGVVSENDAIEVSLERKGMYGINEGEMLRGFEVAMSQKAPAAASSEAAMYSISSQIVMGMDAAELAKTIEASGGDAYWYRDARFCHVRAALEAAAASRTSDSRSGGDEGFAVAVEAASAEGPQAVIEVTARHISKRVSKILMLGDDDLELEGRSIASYGLDSMIGTEMRTWLFKEFGLDFPFQKLLAQTLTFVELGKIAAEKMGYLAATE